MPLASGMCTLFIGGHDVATMDMYIGGIINANSNFPIFVQGHTYQKMNLFLKNEVVAATGYQQLTINGTIGDKLTAGTDLYLSQDGTQNTGMNMYVESPSVGSDFSTINLHIKNVGGSGSGSADMFMRSSDGGSCSDIQSYYFEPYAQSGVYTITIDGNTTENILFNVYEAGIKPAVNALPNIDGNLNSVDGYGTDVSPHVLTFDNSLGDIGELTINSSQLYSSGDVDFTFTPSPSPGSVSHILDIEFDNTLTGFCQIGLVINGIEYHANVSLDSDSNALCNSLNDVMPFTSNTSDTTSTNMGATTVFHLDIDSTLITSIDSADVLLFMNPSVIISSSLDCNGETAFDMGSTTLMIRGSGTTPGALPGNSNMNMYLHHPGGVSSVDLYLNGKKTNEDVDLYVKGVYNQSGTATLVMPDVTGSGDSNAKLFIHGF